MGLQKTYIAILAVLWMLQGLSSPALAVPMVKGTIDLTASAATPGAFGLDDAVGKMFSARLAAVSCDGSVFPADGRACVEVKTFFLQIGDTFWDETMTSPGNPLTFTLLFGDGSVKGLAGEITPYNPAHPDLFFRLPSSPGTWEALDIRTIIDPETGREVERNLGSISGTYTPDLQVVPLPGALALLGLGLARLLRQGRSAG